MPYALVSDQANREVVQGFQMGFQHAASLIQSQRQQEEENKREQMRLDAEAQHQADSIKNQWAMKAMELGVAADQFKKKSAQEKTDEINNTNYNTTLDILNGQQNRLADYLKTNRDYITNSNQYEQAIRGIDTKKAALAQLKTGADGMYDPKDLSKLQQEDSFVTPQLTPEYKQKQALDLEKEKAEIRGKNLSNEKKATGAGSDKKIAKSVADARNGLFHDYNNIQTVGSLVDAERQKYGSDKAWEDAATDDKPGVGANRSKLLTNLNSASRWSAKATQFIGMLNDPQIVSPDIADYVNRSIPNFNNLRSPIDYSHWIAHTNEIYSQAPPSVQSAIINLKNFINGKGAPDTTPDTDTEPQAGGDGQ